MWPAGASTWPRLPCDYFYYLHGKVRCNTHLYEAPRSTHVAPFLHSLRAHSDNSHWPTLTAESTCPGGTPTFEKTPYCPAFTSRSYTHPEKRWQMGTGWLDDEERDWWGINYQMEYMYTSLLLYSVKILSILHQNKLFDMKNTESSCIQSLKNSRAGFYKGSHCILKFNF